MKRVINALSGLAAMSLLAGCQTWKEEAKADAFSQCVMIADAACRASCAEDVMQAATATERAQLAAQRQAILEGEEREALRDAYGLPDKTH